MHLITVISIIDVDFKIQNLSQLFVYTLKLHSCSYMSSYLRVFNEQSTMSRVNCYITDAVYSNRILHFNNGIRVDRSEFVLISLVIKKINYIKFNPFECNHLDPIILFVDVFRRHAL